MLKHDEEELVNELRNNTPRKQNIMMSKIIKKGIIGSLSPSTKSNDKKVCIECKGMYTKSYFYKHACPFAVKPRGVNNILVDEMENNSKFTSEISDSFRADGSSKDCYKDETWKILG